MIMNKIKTIKASYRAAIAPSTYNESKNTFDVTFTTDAPVRRYDWERDRYYNEVLSFDPAHVNLDRLNNAAPLLDNHDRQTGVKSQIGVVERAWIEDGRGAATIRFSNREEVKGIVQDVKDGILKNVSIGYSVKKLKVEDEDNDIPTYRATSWQPFEISLVPVPADPRAQVRSMSELLEEIEVEEEAPLKQKDIQPGVVPVIEDKEAEQNARLTLFFTLNKLTNAD